MPFNTALRWIGPLLRATALLSVHAASFAQDPVTLAQITQVELESIDEGRQAQSRINELDDERVALTNEYRAALKQNADLEKYNNLLRQTVESREDHVGLLHKQIDRVGNLEREIVPLMFEMLDTLERFVTLDLPFLPSERIERIEKLKALMRDGNVSNAEKYRRILEAYQIENDYGRTIEAYDGALSEDDGTGKTKTVTFFKVGRVAYLYQTLDGSQTFLWSRAEQAWQPLDDSYNARIKQGIEMAKEQTPPNLMFVPVEAPPMPDSGNTPEGRI